MDLLGAIPRAKGETRIAWTEFREKKYLDIRFFARIQDEEDLVPTKKGTTIPESEVVDISVDKDLLTIQLRIRDDSGK